MLAVLGLVAQIAPRPAVVKAAQDDEGTKRSPARRHRAWPPAPGPLERGSGSVEQRQAAGKAKSAALEPVPEIGQPATLLGRVGIGVRLAHSVALAVKKIGRSAR